MIFSMEALRSKKGDCLLLHCGKNDKTDLYLIDGGPSGVYKSTLKKRLKKIQEKTDPVSIRLMMVSHTDDDHINGILNLTGELRQREQGHQALPYKIRNLWHNSFDDVLGNGAQTLEAAGIQRLALASADTTTSPDLPLKEEGAAMALASVRQGRALRDDAELLAIPVNRRAGGKLVLAADDPIATPFTSGVEMHVVGPTKSLLEEYRKKWDAYIKAKDLDVKQASLELAEYLDKSAFNLASIVTLVRAEDKEILLTGDARGDFVLESLEERKLLKKRGKRRLGILKVPHHGSSRNVETAFFRRLPADHYVFSGDGEHGNPDVETFEMLFEGRKTDRRKFTIHLTYDPKDYKAHKGKKYPLAKLRKLFKARKDAGRKFEVRFPKAGELGLRIDLLDPYTGP